MLEIDVIETPEHVLLERRLAGIGSRFLAGLLDTLILTGIALLLYLIAVMTGMLVFYGTGGLAGDLFTWTMALLIVLFFLIYWGYFAFFEMGTNGQSPGKKWQRIRVVKDGGGAITFTDIAIRNLLRAVDGLVFYGVAGVCMFISRKAQRLGDLAAGTVVISEKTSDYSAGSGEHLPAEWEQEATAEALRATGLSPEEYRILMNYWVRRNQLTLEARYRLLQTVVRPILSRGQQHPPNESAEELERLLANLIYEANLAGRGGAAPHDMETPE